jgi:hypothetical protein
MVALAVQLLVTIVLGATGDSATAGGMLDDLDRDPVLSELGRK